MLVKTALLLGVIIVFLQLIYLGIQDNQITTGQTLVELELATQKIHKENLILREELYYYMSYTTITKEAASMGITQPATFIYLTTKK